MPLLNQPNGSVQGVETIIPNQEEKTIMVFVSISTLSISELIPEIFRGFAVSFYYVQGLKGKQNLFLIPFLNQDVFVTKILTTLNATIYCLASG